MLSTKPGTRDTKSQSNVIRGKCVALIFKNSLFLLPSILLLLPPHTDTSATKGYQNQLYVVYKTRSLSVQSLCSCFCSSGHSDGCGLGAKCRTEEFMAGQMRGSKYNQPCVAEGVSKVQRDCVIPKVPCGIQGRGRKKRTHPLIPKSQQPFLSSCLVQESLFCAVGAVVIKRS